MALQAFRGVNEQGEKNFSTEVWGALVARQEMSLKSVGEICCVRKRIFFFIVLESRI